MRDQDEFEQWLADFIGVDADKLNRCRCTDPEGEEGYVGLEAEGYSNDADDLASMGLNAWKAARAQRGVPEVTDEIVGAATEAVRYHAGKTSVAIASYVINAIWQLLEAAGPPATPQPDKWAGCSKLTDDLRSILGRPNFACAGIAQTLREKGFDIKPKAENEQAAVIHWLLCLYVEHGSKWRSVAERELRSPTPPKQESEW